MKKRGKFSLIGIVQRALTKLSPKPTDVAPVLARHPDPSKKVRRRARRAAIRKALNLSRLARGWRPSEGMYVPRFAHDVKPPKAVSS